MRGWLLLLAACGSSGDSKPSPQPTAQKPVAPAPAQGADPWATPSTPSVPAGIDAPAKLVIAEHGAEPHRVLSYTVGKVDRTVVFRSQDDDALEADMQYRLQCTPCRYQMTRFAVMGDTQSFDAIAKAVSGTIELTPDGIATIPPGIMKTTPSTPDLFELAIVRFPTEPIGAGAKWSVGAGTKSIVYTLTSLTASGAKVELAGFEGDGQSIAHINATLNVSFNDPVARGELKQRTVMTLSSGEPIEHVTAMTID